MTDSNVEFRETSANPTFTIEPATLQTEGRLLHRLWRNRDQFRSYKFDLRTILPQDPQFRAIFRDLFNIPQSIKVPVPELPFLGNPVNKIDIPISIPGSTNLIEWWIENRLPAEYKRLERLYEMGCKTASYVTRQRQFEEHITRMRRLGLQINPRYNIELTRFTPGGSFDIPSSSVFIDPAFDDATMHQILIHELTHLSIGPKQEELDKLPNGHAFKEALVDAYGIRIMGKEAYGEPLRYSGSSRHIYDQIDKWIKKDKSPQEIVELLLH